MMHTCGKWSQIIYNALWMQTRTKKQKEKEEVQTIFPTDHHGQWIYPQLQHLCADRWEFRKGRWGGLGEVRCLPAADGVIQAMLLWSIAVLPEYWAASLSWQSCAILNRSFFVFLYCLWEAMIFAFYRVLIGSLYFCWWWINQLNLCFSRNMTLHLLQEFLLWITVGLPWVS